LGGDLVLRNRTLLDSIYMQFFQYWVQEYHLYRHIVTKNRMRNWTFEMYKMSGNWGYLIKGPSDWQCVSIHVYAVQVVKKIMW